MDSDLILNIFSKLYDSSVTLSDNIKESSLGDIYYIIPGKDGLRWILPEKPSFGMPVIKQWCPYELTSKFKWKIILTACQLGQLQKLPGIQTINIIHPPHMVGEKLWASSKNNSYSPVIYVGTPGPNQKAVVSVVEQETLAVHCILKIPLGKNADKKIIREANMIKALNKEKPNLGPDIIFMDEKRSVTAQTEISGKLTTKKMTNHHINWLVSLHNHQTTTLGMHCDPLFKKLHQLNDTNAIAISNLMHKILHGKVLSLPLPSVLLHGDFAPWNLKLTPNGIQAIDWEDALEDALPMQDLFHFYYIQAYLFNKKKLLFPNTAEGFINYYCKSLKIPFAMISKLRLYYLANTWLNKKKETNFNHTHFLLNTIKKL